MQRTECFIRKGNYAAFIVGDDSEAPHQTWKKHPIVMIKDVLSEK